MSRQVTHFKFWNDADSWYGEGEYVIACGREIERVASETDTSKVTCRNCRRTSWFASYDTGILSKNGKDRQ